MGFLVGFFVINNVDKLLETVRHPGGGVREIVNKSALVVLAGGLVTKAEIATQGV